MGSTGTYVFYADVYFVQNLLLKVTVLYLALYVNKQVHKINPVRILIAAVAGTLLEILGLIYGPNFAFFTGGIHLMEIPVVMLFLLRKERKKWLQVTVSAWFFVLVVNGVVEAILNLWGETGHFIEMLLLSCLLVWIGTKHFCQYQRMQKEIYPTEIFYKGKKVTCRGFYDSGNVLKDPYTGVGVHIVSKELEEKLKITEEKAVLVPYSSLGNENNLMNVYYMEKMIIYGRKETVVCHSVAVGIGEKGLFSEKNYDLILNESVW